MKYRKHRFQFIILSKNHTGKDRRNIEPGEVWSQRDFAERLTLKFNNEAQMEHFLGGATISIEGVAVEFFRNQEKEMEFHAYFSDVKQQDSAVVNNHMERMIKFLIRTGVLNPGGLLFCNTDVCAAQYCCWTAYFFLSTLAFQHKI